MSNPQATPPSFGSGPQSFGSGPQVPNGASAAEEDMQVPQAQHTDEPVYDQSSNATKQEKSGVSAFVWVALILGALILVLLLVFVMQNNQPVDISYFAWSFSMPLGVALLLAAIAGILIAAIIGTVRIILLGRRLKRAQKNS
ncbi:putative integral membrane protein [Brevibacterium paucivorans]|uniref:Integral membrane protein n=1 Tax=Brevibacterium paucivorans TaxID=170994 RepID=A0ABS2SKT1_9MICO|nr:lipopolysaccharide assembly protein LapA domain-containing protein [Brevibacterium paucivorans]MBM7815636.1 putative integral membrane protein [Brevibacterium paucivorans]